MSIIALAGYKTFAAITVHDDDVKLQAIIDMVNARVPGYLNRVIEKMEVTDEEYDGTGVVELRLSNYPIVSIEKVEVYNWIMPEVLEAVAFEARMFQRGYYIKDANNGILYNLDIWPKGRANIRISSTVGYETLPSDLTYACYKIVEYYYSIGKHKTGVISESLGAYSYSLATGFNAPGGYWYIPNEAKFILDSYKDIGGEIGF